LRSSYVRGRAAEYWIKWLLEELGYFVIRSAGSHTPIDLLAAKDGARLAVQVKVKGYLTREEKERLIRWAKQFEAKPMLATKKRGRWVLKEVRERGRKGGMEEQASMR
jgi:Holliday junction resolvase